MNAKELAIHITALQVEIAHLEEQLKQAKEDLVKAYPTVLVGEAPPYFSVSIAHRIVLDQPKAAAYYVKHKDHRCLFSLSLKKDDYERIGAPKFATIKPNAPTIKPDRKALEL